MNEELLMQALQSGQITPEEYKQFKQNLQGLLGQSPVDMPQAPEPTMPMIPMPIATPSTMGMSPMPQITQEPSAYDAQLGRNQAERDFLQQFVDKKRPNPKYSY